MSETNIRNKVRTMIGYLVGIIFLLLINGVLLAYTVGNMMAKPIYEITRGAEEVGKGNLDHVIKVKGDDEIGELAKAFNRMTGNLKSSMDMLVQSEKLASLGQLAAGVAHEINNPLTNILLDAEAIRDMEMDEDSRKERLDEIVSQVEVTGKIVTNLLEFSRQSEPMTMPTEIEKLIDEALEIAILNTRDVEVIKDYEGNLPEVKGDPIQLKQVFLNIILNSLQAMSKGGRLEIATGMEDEFIRISFEDTGTGISRENLDKVFDPFFTTNKVGEGTGLGLSLCLGIIERHGGKIDVQSQPGKGSVFTVRLPAGVKDG
jgi:two-component system NtrC family sensor kinase